MTLAQFVVSRLWWGRLRRPFEAIARRTAGKQSRILFGPTKGSLFTGGLAQVLGIYEVHVQGAIHHNLKEGDVFYDVGANNGYFSLLGAKRVGSKGHVYAFDPLPQNTETIRKVMIDNDVSNYTVVPEAVSNAPGTAQLYIEDCRNTSTPSLMQRPGNQTLSVRTITLDEFVNRHRWPNLIKLDVEGAEVFILEGASSILTSERSPKWIVEIHSRENDLSIKGILGSLGYHTRVLVPPSKKRKPYPCHVLAWR